MKKTIANDNNKEGSIMTARETAMDKLVEDLYEKLESQFDECYSAAVAVVYKETIQVSKDTNDPGAMYVTKIFSNNFASFLDALKDKFYEKAEALFSPSPAVMNAKVSGTDEEGNFISDALDQFCEENMSRFEGGIRGAVEAKFYRENPHLKP